jgi:riboflavin kinase/FMN adenylyltransferase
MIPKYGVYIGLASIEGDSKKYKAAINIGVRPTVDNEPNLHIEAHLISFNQDIYDKTLTLELVERIRDEQKFEHFDQLILQIKSDIAWVKNYSIPS